MKNLIKKILKESEVEWMENVPSDYDLVLYDFLNEEFKVENHEALGIYGEQIKYKTLSGLDEIFLSNIHSKKEILNTIYWLVVEDYPKLSEGQIRKTIRVFLNEKFN